jgi:CubicO group peptidase (beta-lactamase class C family)
MADGGFSASGLDRLHGVLSAHLEQAALPGLIALVAREGGAAHVEVIGTPSFGDSEPLSRRAIFRIASLSKPIAAAAAMVLVDRGVLGLDDPVDEWLPELADRRVLRRIDAALDDTVPARRPITLGDLLTFRMGFGAVMGAAEPYPIQIAEEKLELKTLGPPWPPTPCTPDQWIQRFGSLPLMHQPGEHWMYNTGIHVVGVLLERAVGMPLERVLQRLIFEPLGMVDTSFTVTPDRLDRLTTAYMPDPDSGAVEVLDGVEDSYWRRPLAFPNAAGWLVSTIDDFWAFVRMLLSGGVFEGSRILSAEAVELMTTDALTDEQRSESSLFLGTDGGWGLGMRVPASTGVASEIPGGFGWDGGTGTMWRSDVERGLTGILFTQRAMTSPAPPNVAVDFWTAAYGALDG